MGPIAQQRAKRNRNLSLATENGHQVIREAGDNGAVVTVCTTDPADRFAELNRTRGYNFAGKRLSEIEALIRDRHGGPVNDTDDGEAYLSAALNAKAWIRIFLGMKQHPAPLIDWAAEWTPLVPAEHVRKLAERVCAKPRKMKAVTVGKMFRASAEECNRLDLTTIFPCDIDREEHEKKRKEIKAENDRAAKAAARAASGMTPRSESLKALCGDAKVDYRKAKRYKGREPAAVLKMLAKHGLDEKCPLFGALIGVGNPSNIGAEKGTSAGRSRPAPAPPPERQEDELATKGDTGDDSADDIPANRDQLAVGASTAAVAIKATPEPPRGATLADSTEEDGADPEAIPAWFLAEAEERARKHARMAELAAHRQSAAPKDAPLQPCQGAHRGRSGTRHEEPATSRARAAERPAIHRTRAAPDGALRLASPTAATIEESQMAKLATAPVRGQA